MNQEKNQANDESLFPAFRFDLENRLIYANAPAQPLMHFWQFKLNERIPANVVSLYPELFHSALSHRPMDVTVQMKNYTIRFSIVPFPEAGYIGMYAYCMEVHENYTNKTSPALVAINNQ